MIEVVAAVVQEAGQFLLCQRHDGPHLALKWEFPGGKIETNETPEAALRREISEELGVDCSVGRQIAEVTHHYPEKSVRIRFFLASLEGRPQPIVHRALEWIRPRDFCDFESPPPNSIVLDRIRSGDIRW